MGLLCLLILLPWSLLSNKTTYGQNSSEHQWWPFSRDSRCQCGFSCGFSSMASHFRGDLQHHGNRLNPFADSARPGPFWKRNPWSERKIHRDGGTVPKCRPNSLVPPSFQTLRLWKNHPVISGISLRTQLRRSLIICWWQNGSSELQMPKNGLPDFVMGPSMKASFTWNTTCLSKVTV